MIHAHLSKLALWLTATVSLVVTPLAGYAFTSNLNANPWEQRTVSGFATTDAYASDHIVVKWENQAPTRIAVTGGSSVAETIRYWSTQDNVEFAEPDNLIHAMSTAETTSWGYDAVQAAAAASTNGATGAGVIVAVVDTGVDYLHEDLDANNWVNSGETPDNSVDDDGNGYVDDYYGYDFIGSLYTAVTPDADPEDEAGHGTHVAGIIAAEDNSVGVKGIAPSAQIMPVKVLDAGGSGWDSTIADGIRYAVDEGADIINLSLGASLPSNTVKAAIDYAESNNVLVVAAAGNSNSYTASSYPAGYSSVISVGATTEDGYKADYSNWGKVDILAPGDDILSSIPGNLYERYSGTSMASPMVSGVAALVMQKFSTNARATRQILEHTADDFGTIAGADYLSGAGTVNALDATGTQTASTILYADTGALVTNGTTTATIYASVRNASHAAVVGDTVTWSTNTGTLSVPASVTDANGIASVTLTVDDADGLVTVTGDPATADSAVMQLALLSDIPTIPVQGIYPMETSSATPFGGGGVIEEDITVAGEDNVYQAGEQVIAYAYPTGHDLQAHDATITYSVTDANGDSVADLSGTSQTIVVGESYYGIFYFPQTYWESIPLTIPSDAVDGEYTLTMTVTDADSSETSTNTTTFWVNDTPEVLIVANGGCDDAPIQGLSYGGVAHCVAGTERVVTAMDQLGYSTMVWNTELLGSPTEVIANYPLVIWLDTAFWPADSTEIQNYLDAGGNLLFSSENMQAANAGGRDFNWNYLHAQFVSTLYEPDTVTGTTDSLFSGLTLNIDPYVLSGTGVSTNYSVDEITVNTADDALNAFQYNLGDGVDRSAGVQVETDNYRLLYLTFGIENINDEGSATLESFLETAVDWLRGDRQTITSVKAKRLSNSSEHTITIRGTNFQTTGTTKVKLRDRLLDNVVVQSRHKITATVPAGLSPRRYSLTVVNPDGRKVTEQRAIRVVNGGLTINSLTNTYASNNADRTIEISGSHFKSSAKVYLGTTELTEVVFNGSTSLTATVPADFAVGRYAVRVVNPNGDTAKSSGFVVRQGFTENLGLGDHSAQVKALENRLKTAGYFSGKTNAEFDADTEEALVRYQTDNMLTLSGRLDAGTRYYLNNNQ